MCFGLSAACCKTGIQLVAKMGWIAFPTGLMISVLMSSLGFMLQTLGLKDGNTVIVCTCAAVASMATGTHKILFAESVGVAEPKSFLCLTKLSR